MLGRLRLRCLGHIDHRRLGQALQLRQGQRKHRMWVAGCRPQHVKALQRDVDQGHRFLQVRHGADTADGKTGLCFDVLGICAANLTDQGRYFFLIDTAIARRNHQHRHPIEFAPKDHALGNLAQQDAQLVRGFLSSTRRTIEHCGVWPWLASCKKRATRCTPSGRTKTSAPHIYTASQGAALARLARMALATRDWVVRPSASLMKAPVSTSLSRSSPVSMPMPCSM